MQSRTLDKAFAATNLINVGWNPREVKQLADLWSKRQTEQSVEKILTEAGKLKVVDDLGSDCAGKMYLSFHYSVYPTLYRALAKQSTNRTIYSLIGSQTPEQCCLLQSLAAAEDINIHFVQSGMRMVSEMKRGLDRGHIGLILLDIPWSKQKTPPDRTYSAFGGSFESLSTVERLVDLIDKHREVVSVSRDQSNRVCISRLGQLPFSDAFSRLGELIERDPADYERLHQFHRYFVFSETKSTVVSFCVKEQRYAVIGPSMRTIKVSRSPVLDAAEVSAHGLCEAKGARLEFNRILGENVEHILCL